MRKEIQNKGCVVILIILSVITPINVFADYSGRHFNNSSADFLLIMTFIAIVTIAFFLFISGNRKKQQVKETVTTKHNHNDVPIIDIKKSTIPIISVSSLEKQAQKSSYMRSFFSNFSNMSSTQKDEIQRILNKGACDAAREYNDHLESDSKMDSQLFLYSSKEQEESIKDNNRSKRHFYSPPLNYSIYYDLAYDTVMSDRMIKYTIKHDIESGIIQC